LREAFSEINNVAPLFTVISALDWLFFNSRVPSLTVILPVNELDAEKVSFVFASFETEPEPEISPFTVTSLLPVKTNALAFTYISLSNVRLPDVASIVNFVPSTPMPVLKT
jgi:hypothetical protein